MGGSADRSDEQHCLIAMLSSDSGFIFRPFFPFLLSGCRRTSCRSIDQVDDCQSPMNVLLVPIIHLSFLMACNCLKVTVNALTPGRGFLRNLVGCGIINIWPGVSAITDWDAPWAFLPSFIGSHKIVAWQLLSYMCLSCSIVSSLLLDLDFGLNWLPAHAYKLSSLLQICFKFHLSRSSFKESILWFSWVVWIIGVLFASRLWFFLSNCWSIVFCSLYFAETKLELDQAWAYLVCLLSELDMKWPWSGFSCYFN